jgi:hypothetical protein
VEVNETMAAVATARIALNFIVFLLYSGEYGRSRKGNRAGVLRDETHRS